MASLSAGTVSLSVKADATGFGKALASQISKEANTSGLSSIGKGIGGTILAGMGAALVGVAAIVKTGITETLDASAGTAQLAAGIKSTGNAANVSIKGMNDLASSIQNYSGQTDDSIVASEQLLLTFTGIKNVGADKIFDRATMAAADMAAKMGGDAASQSILLGKALNDPVKGITALTRVGVSFTDGQKATIAAMVKTGDTVGAQKIILGELNTEFGGAAKAAGESLPGQLARGQRGFEDLSQTVVSTILPVILPTIQKFVKILQDAAPHIQDVAKTVAKDLGKAITDLTPTVMNLGSFIGGTLLPALSKFGDWAKSHAPILLGIAGTVVSMVVAFKAYQAIMGVVKIATILWSAAQAILNGALIANPIGLIVIAIAGLVAGIIYVATQTTFFQDVWAAMTKFIVEAVGNVLNWLSDYWPVLLSLIIGPLGLAIGWVVKNWGGIVSFFQDTVGNIGAIIGTVFGAIGGTIRNAFNGVVDFVKGIFNTIIGLVNDIIRGVNGATSLGGAIGITIGKIPTIPNLAEGATILPTPGGTVVRVAEGGRSESVVDTAKMNKRLDDDTARGGSTFIINESVSAVATAMQVNRMLVARRV